MEDGRWWLSGRKWEVLDLNICELVVGSAFLTINIEEGGYFVLYLYN